MPFGDFGPLFPDDLFSAAFADQAVFDEEDAVPVYEVLETTRPEFSFDREIEDLGLSSPQDFAKPARKVGARSGTVTFSVPLRSQLATYDPSSGPPVINPEIKLLAEALGSSVIGTFVGGAIGATSTANNWESTAVPGVGEYYATGTGVGVGSAVGATGWVTNADGASILLFEDGRAIPADGDDLVQTITLFPLSPVNAQPTPKTFRLKGEQGEHDIRVVGCIPETITLDLSAGEVPTATFSYRFTDWKYVDLSEGLLSAAAFQRLAPIMKVNSGRVWLDGIVDKDGVAEVTGTCGIGSLQIEIALSLKVLKCHGAEQATSLINVNKRMAKVTFTAPMVNELLVGDGRSIFERSLEDDVPFSFSVIVGDTVGQLFALLMPAGVVVAQPSPASVEDGYIGWAVEMEADAYAGDGGSGGAATNSAFRMAFG